MRRMDEKGVSPVIGVILMVAITVILAAVIASFVFGMAGTVKKQYTVVATASILGNEIVITYQGGPDHQLLSELNVTACGNGSTGTFNTTAVGATFKCGTNSATPNPDHVVVVAKFKDGTEQVILDTYV